MPCSREQLMQTANTVITAYNAWNIDAILAPRSSTCIQQILPTSLQRPPLDNAAYRTYFGPLMPAFRNWHVEIKEDHTTIDEEKKRVLMWVTSTADTDLGKYENEYWILVEMTEDGTKAEKVWEWVDSAYSQAFIPKLRQHLIEQKQKENRL